MADLESDASGGRRAGAGGRALSIAGTCLGAILLAVGVLGPILGLRSLGGGSVAADGGDGIRSAQAPSSSWPVMPSTGPAAGVAYLAPYLRGDEDWATQGSSPAPAGGATVAWASTVAFEHELDGIAIPANTIATLPPDGVVVTVETVPSSFDPSNGPFPYGPLELDLATATRRAPEAEEPPGDVAVLEIVDPQVLVRVYFGTPTPSSDLVASAQRELDTLQLPPVCPVPARGGGFGATLSADVGAPGDVVTISGPMPFEYEDGSYDTSGDTRIIAWWNASPAEDDWPFLSSFSTTAPSPAVEGVPLVRLGEDGGAECSFSIAFEVPDVPPGDYPLVVLQEGGSGPTAGSALEAALVFHVR